MQRKGYVLGTAALLGALLTGCTGGSGLGDTADDSKPGDSGDTGKAAEPGRYRTLPDPCRAVGRGTLDGMLPGIRSQEQEQREQTYAGTAEVTYDTDRRVGCTWQVESGSATHRLQLDFERVVSYDGSASDDERAHTVYAGKLAAADLPDPSPSPGESEEESQEESEKPEESESGSPKASASDADGTADGTADGAADGATAGTADGKPGEKPQNGGQERADTTPPKGGDVTGTADPKAPKGSKGATDPKGSGSPKADESPTVPAGLEPRTLDELGDEAFLDDRLAAAAAATQHRTVTVVFRTSNVIVTIAYDEQPDRRSEVPDSKELQDKARALAAQLAEQFTE